MRLIKNKLLIKVLVLLLIFFNFIMLQPSLNNVNLDNLGFFEYKDFNLSINTWITDGNIVCNRIGDQRIGISPNETSIIYDEIGGAILVWREKNETIDILYIQKINNSGEIQWQINGLPLCTALGYRGNFNLCPDKNGGSFITWEDNRTGNLDIYLQHIDSNGTMLLDPNGSVICNETGEQSHPQIYNEGVNGCVIVWQDNRSGNFDLYAQKLNQSQLYEWADNGTTICVEIGDQINPEINSDINNGCYIIWVDKRAGNYDIYAQRLNSTGNSQWNINGIAICNRSQDQISIKSCLDLEGGIIVSWEDYRVNGYPNNPDIYIQRLNSTGNTLWESNGTRICNTIKPEKNQQLCNDGTGGAIITWEEYYTSSDIDIYAERVNGTGTRLWNSKIISITPQKECSPRICNTTDGAIIVWYYNDDLDLPYPFSLFPPIDNPYFYIFHNYFIRAHLHAVRLDKLGGQIWGRCSFSSNGDNVQICRDGSGGVYIIWDEIRSDNFDIFTQRITAEGVFPELGISVIIIPKGVPASYKYFEYFLYFLVIGIVCLGITITIYIRYKISIVKKSREFWNTLHKKKSY